MTRRHSHHHRLHLTSLLLGVQCFNTVVASTVYYFFADTFEPMRHSWYALRAMGSRPTPQTRLSHDPLLPLCRYVCGVTPLKLGEFFLAYFVGALKVTFLDAYLGSMLTSAALATDDVAASTKARDGPQHKRHAAALPTARHRVTPDFLSPDPQGVVVVETLFIVIVSVLITQFATGLFAEMMAAEGFEVAGAAESPEHCSIRSGRFLLDS